MINIVLISFIKANIFESYLILVVFTCFNIVSKNGKNLPHFFTKKNIIQNLARKLIYFLPYKESFASNELSNHCISKLIEIQKLD